MLPSIEPMHAATRTLWAFLWYFLQKFKWKLVALVLVALVLALDLSFRPYTIKLIVDGLVTTDSISKNLFQSLCWPIFGYLGSVFTLVVAFRTYDIVRLLIVPQLQSDIIKYMFSYTEYHAHAFFQNRASGGVASQIATMAFGAKEILKLVIDKFFAHTLSFVFASITLFFTHQALAVTFICWTFFFLIATVKMSKKTNRFSEKLSECQNDVQGFLVDSLANVMTVRLFHGYKQENSFVHNVLERQVQAEKKLEWETLKIRAVQSGSVLVLLGVQLFILLYAYQYKMVTVGDFALTFSLSLAMTEIIWNLSDDFVTFSVAVGQCQESLKIIKAMHVIQDQAKAHVLTGVQGGIIFENVTFSFENQQPIFSHLSVEIKPCHKIGIVGFSGAGKSTFVNLIARVFDVQSGSIKIDGHDIRSITQQSLRQHISFVPQDPVLFHRTIYENISYAIENISYEEVIEAAKKAQIHNFIMDLKQGYEASVGDRGIKISSGQRQRIALARAFLRNTPLLIMDEATSALDVYTEQLIQTKLYEFIKDKTVIVIAHRLSTLQTMDRILVFENGILAEDGPPEVVLHRRNGYYSKLTKEVQ